MGSAGPNQHVFDGSRVFRDFRPIAPIFLGEFVLSERVELPILKAAQLLLRSDVELEFA